MGEIVIAGKRALLRCRMQRAYNMPGYDESLYGKFKKQVARALHLKRMREIARGITKEQSRRLKRRQGLEMKMSYEEAYGAPRPHEAKASQKWKGRMGLIF